MPRTLLRRHCDTVQALLARVEGQDDSGVPRRKMTKPADLKSAGQPAVQVLYKRSPECSKTPQNALLRSISHNNIRKTGSIRNRQVSGSSPLVGPILFRTLRTSSPLPTVQLQPPQVEASSGSIAGCTGAPHTRVSSRERTPVKELQTTICPCGRTGAYETLLKQILGN